MKELIKRLIKRAGFTVSRAPDLSDFLKSRNVNLVFDVGANAGQFARSLRSAGYVGKIVSFEPINSVFSQLSASMAKDDNWFGHNCALGSSQGKGTINVSENSVFSSLLPLASYASRFDSKSQVTRTEEINILTLDGFFEEIGKANAFLKIDTQGFEKHVIEGGPRSMQRICGLQLELPIKDLYEDNWDLVTALSYLENLGFVPAQMRATTLMSEDPECWTEIDCIFRRK